MLTHLGRELTHGVLRLVLGGSFADAHKNCRTVKCGDNVLRRCLIDLRTPESSARGSPGEIWQAEAKFGPKTFGRGQILAESSSKIMPKTFGLPANLPGPLSGVLRSSPPFGGL